MPTIYSKVTVAPASEPIALDDAKNHLKVDNTEDDDLITLLIQTAREIAEESMGRSLITQTRQLKLDYFPHSSEIKIPYGPITSGGVVITYYDENEDEQTLSSDNYWVDATTNIGRVVVKTNWPATYDKPNAVTIQYVAGTAAGSVPKPIVSAMYLILGHLYQHREEVGDIKYQVPFGANVLMAPYVLEQSVYY